MEKTTKNGIHRIRQEGGKTIAWAEESGVKVLEKDGYYFKDLAKTGELLPSFRTRRCEELFLSTPPSVFRSLPMTGENISPLSSSARQISS